MPHRLLYTIIFIEGFCSLGAEVLALRRLVPHVGSAIVITAPTIGLFLLALALGYARGAAIGRDYLTVVTRNFLAAGALAGLGLSRVCVDSLFAHIQPAPLAYLLFVGGIVCPLAWLLGQTVPLLTNLMQHQRTGEASGQALYWSTLGSFLGSVSLSLLVMQWLGVSAAVIACALLLIAGVLLIPQNLADDPNTVAAPSAGARRLAAGVVAALTLGANLAPTGTAEVNDTAYADYSVTDVTLPGQQHPRAFQVNQSVASLMDDSKPPHYARYVHRLRTILLDELALRDRDILVLGAGGFNLSHHEAHNRYTYVDIDPAIRTIAEERFLHEPINGDFIIDDARHFIHTSTRQYDAIVVDVFSSHTAIPGHLVTQEFWQDTRQRLTPDGMLLANLILAPDLHAPFARNLLATIESVYGPCAVEVLHRRQPLSNVVVSCHNIAPAEPPRIYRDEHNPVDVDRLR